MLKPVTGPHRHQTLRGNLAKEETLPIEWRIRNRSARIAVLGLGYAGLPMAIELAEAGFVVTGLDVNEERVKLVNEGKSPVSNVDDAILGRLLEKGRLRASNRFTLLAEADCALICVPTPLLSDKTPDLQYVEAAGRSIAAYLHPDMLVVLQSTCSPGTTRRVLLQSFKAGTNLRVGEEFFLAAAPERIDPGNRTYTVRNTPKVVGGVTARCSQVASLFYETICDSVVTVSSPEVAEMAKLIENTFRFINISFMNEMARLCDRMGISIWEVVEAAATKPFAFMPHYPGPGVGGHCIPVVPFYLEASAREYDMAAELIEVAGRINEEMPGFVVSKLERLLAERGKPLASSRILLLGMTYKADVDDTRESSGLRVLQLLLERGMSVSYHDPHVPSVHLGETTIASLTAEELAQEWFDCGVLLVAHSGVDYLRIARRVELLLDTRHHLPSLEGTEVVCI